MFFSLLKFSIFPPFCPISIPISISKFPQSSISISKSIFWKWRFQYQYQNQYFETAVFNIKININMSKILTFQKFSKFCAMSDTHTYWFNCRHIFQKAQLVSNKNAYNVWHFFLTYYIMHLHTVWSLLFRVLALEITFWLVEILLQPITSLYLNGF